jgi:uncharacterized protein YndB with AHSA1/START domain
MITFTDSVTISRPPNQVFSYLADLNNIPKWNPEVKTFVLVTEGPTKVGSRFIEESRLGTVNCTVTEISPDNVIAFDGVSSLMNYTERILIESAESGTRLTVTATIDLKGLWKILQPIMAGEFKSGAKKELTAIKSNFERR